VKKLFIIATKKTKTKNESDFSFQK